MNTTERRSIRNWAGKLATATCVFIAAAGATACSRDAAPSQTPGTYGTLGVNGAPGSSLRLGPFAVSAMPTLAGDPINNVDLPWLRAQSLSDYRELTTGLEPAQKQRIDGIPLVFDDSPGEVNAFASCTSNGVGVIALTDGLLDVAAHLAQCQATDELFGTRKTDEYIRFVVENQGSGMPLTRPPESFWNPLQKHDPRKLSRQHEIYDEVVGFVTGHEMGHHYLGHLPCSAGNVTASEANQVLRQAAPGFNQVNEVGADNGATRNILTTGSKRNGYRWTEGGGLLIMRFFAGLSQFRPTDIVFNFQRTHPPAQLRMPLIQQTASTWRMTGGASPGIGGIQLPIPLPF